MFGDRIGGLREFSEQGGIIQRCSEFSVEPFADKSGTTAGDIDQFADKIRIDASDEVVKIEIDIVHARTQLGRVVITQVIRVEIVQVGSRFDECAARFRHLLAVDRQKTVRENTVWRPES